MTMEMTRPDTSAEVSAAPLMLGSINRLFTPEDARSAEQQILHNPAAVIAAFGERAIAGCPGRVVEFPLAREVAFINDHKDAVTLVTRKIDPNNAQHRLYTVETTNGLGVEAGGEIVFQASSPPDLADKYEIHTIYWKGGHFHNERVTHLEEQHRRLGALVREINNLAEYYTPNDDVAARDWVETHRGYKGGPAHIIDL